MSGYNQDKETTFTYDDLIKMCEEIDAEVLKRQRKMFSVFGADFDNGDRIVLGEYFKNLIDIPYDLRERITIDKNGILEPKSYVVIRGDTPKPELHFTPYVPLLKTPSFIVNITA